MSSTYGENLKLSIFGQSHGPAIGMVLDGIPAGLPVDMESLAVFLRRRAKMPIPPPERKRTRRNFWRELRRALPAALPLPPKSATPTPVLGTTTIFGTAPGPATRTTPLRSNTVAFRTPPEAATFPAA